MSQSDAKSLWSSQSSLGLAKLQKGEAKKKKKESIFTLFIYIQESST